jgi:inosine-uridine nucleoside N-ribohydrolase
MRELVTAPEVHGATGLGGTTTPEPNFPLDPRHAVDLIVELFEHSDGSTVLVPTGPLTNVAMALLRAPHIKEKIKRIVLMGGSIALGNHTPSAEFNIFVDPHAAHIVFTSGVPITMVGLDVTHKAVTGPDEAAEIRGLGTEVGTLVADMLDFYGAFHKRQYGWDTIPLHDPCCIAELISPGLIETRPMNVQIETCSPLTLGRTVCDVIGVTELPPTAEVGIDIDRNTFVEILMDCLQRYS